MPHKTSRLQLFPLLGLLQGVGFAILVEMEAASSLLTLSFWFPFIGLVPLLYYYTFDPEQPRKGVVFSLVSAALFSGMFAMPNFQGAADIMPDPFDSLTFFVLILIMAINLTYYRALQTGEDKQTRYNEVYNTVWTVTLSILMALGFMGIVWLLLFLTSALFNLIGIDFVETLMAEKFFTLPVSFMAIGGGIAVLLEQERLLRAVHSLVQSLLKLLAPVLAVLLLLFLSFIPFTGLEPLWNTASAAGLLLAMVLVAGLLINAATEREADADPRANPNTPAATLLLLRISAMVLPILVAIAAYALWLRVDQYGLTPERVIVGAIILTAAIFSIGYTLAAMRGSNWPATIRGWNYLALPATGLIGILMLTPVGNPERLTLSSQLDRLETGRVSVDEFDFGLLQFELGAAGKQAIKEIRAGQHLPAGADAGDALTRLDNSDYYYDWRSRSARADEDRVPFDEAEWRNKFLLTPNSAPCLTGSLPRFTSIISHR